MRLQQMRKEVQELRKAIISPNISSENLLPTPELLRCSKELKMGQARARQRLIEIVRYPNLNFLNMSAEA